MLERVARDGSDMLMLLTGSRIASSWRQTEIDKKGRPRMKECTD